MDHIRPFIKPLSMAYQSIRKGDLKTLAPLLPLFLLEGRPLNLSMHYQLLPMYSTLLPPHSVYMIARQLGKSYAICSSGALRCGLIPYYHTLMVQPRADQIQRLNNTVLRPLISNSPVRSMLMSSAELGKMALKQFKSGSILYLDYAFVSADRLRGVSGAASVYLDEVQDIEYEFLPVIEEVTSASRLWGFTICTGTPKTTDTTLGLLWRRSSQAEWIIPCPHCGFFNIPNPEQHLEKMIGKNGIICAKCGKPVDPKDGGYVHAYPDKQLVFPGYHIGQPIHPMHLSSPGKWNRLLGKIESYSKLTLYNEVFGWPYDESTSPLILQNLIDAQHTYKCKDTNDVLKYIHNYRCVAVGVDWGGGGAISDSYTAMAVTGLRKDSDVLDVLYCERFKKPMDPMDEAKVVMNWILTTGADIFAYDNGGAGYLRLEMMKQLGLLDVQGLVSIPYNYVRPRSGDIVQLHKSERETDLYYYTLDKSRSLAVNVQAIKDKRLRIPPFNPEDENAPQMDLLALREDPRTGPGNNIVILIIKKPGVPDDTAHAINFGASAIWDRYGAYPKLGVKYDASILEFDENHQKIMPDEAFGPRGDFDRFQKAVNDRVTVIQNHGYDTLAADIFTDYE